MSTLTRNRNLLKSVEEYVKNIPYISSLLICTVSTYLYFLTNYSISVDDLSRERYILDGYLMRQGRFSATLINYVFDFFYNHSSVSDFLGVLLLALAAILFCILFDRCYETKSKTPHILFSCFLVSSPIFVELFTYSGCALATGLGMFLVAIAQWYVFKIIDGKAFSAEAVKNGLISTTLLTFVASWYESVLFVYYANVFALITLKMLSEKTDDKFNLKKIFAFGATFAVPLLLSVIIEFALQNILLDILNVEIIQSRTNSVEISNLFSIGTIKAMIASSIYRYVIPALYYLPITLLVGAMIIAAVVYLILSKRNFRFLLVFIGLASSTAIITILRASPAEYRTNHPISFFVAFIVFLVLVCAEKKKTSFRRVLTVALVIICINQITEVNYWFNLENMRYQNEKQTVENIALELNKSYDLSKPVVFVGEYEVGGKVKELTTIQKDTFEYSVLRFVGENIVPWDMADEKSMLRIPQTICVSYITWGVTAFGEVNTELLKFFSYLGYDLKQGTQEMYDEALVVAENLPSWPKNGSIVDNEDYILVNFGVKE